MEMLLKYIKFFLNNWYWSPVSVGFLRVPYSPKNAHRDKNIKKLKLKFILTRYRKVLAYRQFFLRILEFYLEDKLKNILNNSVRIRFYNVLDYYNIYETNILSAYMSLLVKLFPKDQKNIGKTFAIGLQKYKRSEKVINLFFKILREVFYLIPLKSENGKVLRAEYLKIQIAGKINGQMRAVKKIYSFSYYKGKQVPIQTLNIPVDYSLAESYTFAGVLGIKVWIC